MDTNTSDPDEMETLNSNIINQNPETDKTACKEPVANVNGAQEIARETKDTTPVIEEKQDDLDEKEDIDGIKKKDYKPVDGDDDVNKPDTYKNSDKTVTETIITYPHMYENDLDKNEMKEDAVTEDIQNTGIQEASDEMDGDISMKDNYPGFDNKMENHNKVDTNIVCDENAGGQNDIDKNETEKCGESIKTSDTLDCDVLINPDSETTENNQNMELNDDISSRSEVAIKGSAIQEECHTGDEPGPVKDARQTDEMADSIAEITRDRTEIAGGKTEMPKTGVEMSDMGNEKDNIDVGDGHEMETDRDENFGCGQTTDENNMRDHDTTDTDNTTEAANQHNTAANEDGNKDMADENKLFCETVKTNEQTDEKVEQSNVKSELPTGSETTDKLDLSGEIETNPDNTDGNTYDLSGLANKLDKNAPDLENIDDTKVDEDKNNGEDEAETEQVKETISETVDKDDEISGSTSQCQTEELSGVVDKSEEIKQDEGPGSEVTEDSDGLGVAGEDESDMTDREQEKEVVNPIDEGGTATDGVLEETMEVADEGTELLRTVSEDDVLSKKSPTHLLALWKCLEMFRLSDRLCDFTIKVGDAKFRVHKLILCATSPTFLNLLTTKDKPLSELAISDVSPSAVEVFIHYLYTGELKLKPSQLTELQTLASEYSVVSLKTVLDKSYTPFISVHTQAEMDSERPTLVKSLRQPQSVHEPRKKVSSGKAKTAESITAESDKCLSKNVVESDNDSRLLESDDDDNDMDYCEYDDDDLLNESPIHSDIKESVHKDKAQSQTAAKPSNESASKFSSEKVPEQIKANKNQSTASPRERFPNIAAGLQALREARRKREMGLHKPSVTQETKDKQCTDTDSQTDSLKKLDKPLGLKVRVEKLPPTINPSVTVVVSDDSDDLGDSEIEFVAEKPIGAVKSEADCTKREFTLEEKEQIALEAKRYGTTQTSKTRNIPLPDILSWMTFFGLRKASDNDSKKYGKQINHEADLSIVRWIMQQQEINGSVNLDAMRNYALAIYRQSQPNFVASKTWLANFFKRNISVLQGTSFVHGGDEEGENQSDIVPVKLTQLPLLVDPTLAQIESQLNEHESNMSRQSSTQDEEMDTTDAELPSSIHDSFTLDAQEAESLNEEEKSLQINADLAENLGLNFEHITDFDSLGSISNSVKPKVPEDPCDRELGGISKELLAKIKSKPVVIGTAVTFDAKTERKLAEWLIDKQQQDGYVYRDDFIEYARTLKKGPKSFRGTHGWIQLFMRRNSVKLPLLKQVVLKSKFKTYYSDQEKKAIVQQARMLGVPHVAKMLGINSGVIHSWKVGMDAEERKKGGPKNFEKVTRSVTRAFPSVSKEVDERIDNSLKEQIKARIDVETRRKASANANRGPDPELESEAIAKIKEAGIVRYQDVQKICYEVYSKKRPEFQASKSWVLKFVNSHVLGLEDVELLKSWFVYPEKNQLRLKYEDKMRIIEDEKTYGMEETAKMHSISCGTIRFWKKYPPSPEDDEEDVAPAVSSNRRGIRTNDFEYVPSKFQAGKKVRRRVVIGDAVMFTAEQELQLVQWIHDHLMEDNSVFTDDFRQYAKSLYTGDKIFSATSTWMTKFIRRNPVLQGVNFISKYKRFFTEEEKYAAVLEARRFGTSYVAKKLNADSGLINAWKMKFAKYSAKRMAKLKQRMQLDRGPLQSLVSEREALPHIAKSAEIENPDMSLEEIEKEVGSGLHSYSGAIPIYEREIVELIRAENDEKGGVTYEDISRLCRSVYEKTRPHFKASYNWTQEFIKRNEEALGDVNILNKKKVFVEDDEPINASTSKPYRRDRNSVNEPADVSPLLQKIMSKKPVLLGQSRTLDPQNERKLVQWMVQKQKEDGYVFVDEFNEYAKSLYKGTKKFAATQAWRILFFKRNKVALKGVKLESKYRKQFTREEKMAIVSEARRLGIGHVARKLNVNSSLIYSWGFGKTPQLTQDELANKDIEQDVGKGLYTQRGIVPTLESEIVKKIMEMQNKEGSVSYNDISQISVEVYKETRPNFKASYNWTMDFIRRHKEELKGVDIENMKKVYYENEDEEQPGLQSFIRTLNQNMDTNISDSMVQIENLEQGHGIDFNAHSFEESNLNLNDLIDSIAANSVKQEPKDHAIADSDPVEMDVETSTAILERIRASKPDIVAQPKTFDMAAEKKMVKWVNERQERDGYVFTDDFVAYAKSLYTGSETFSGSQTWRKNFLRRHRKELGNIVFRSKLVNQYTDEEKEMVLEEVKKFGVGYVAQQCGIDHKLIWSWKVRADQNQKAKQNAFWKGPKKTTSVISKPSNVKHASPRPMAAESTEPIGDAYRGVVPEFEDRIIRTIVEHQNREGSISYEEISEISREIYQETKPNFKAGYGWIKNFLERHKNRLKNIDIENMKKIYLPDDDTVVRATGKNIREASEVGVATADCPTGLETDDGSLASLQRLIAKKPIVIGVPKSFNAKTEKKLVHWLLEQQAEQGYAFLDEFKEYASSLYAGDKKFAATNAWRTKFFRRNHAALKNVKIVSKFRKTFTEEEKIAIVKEAKRLGVGHVSRQLDIGHGNINVWMRELEAKGRIMSGVVESPRDVSESSNSSFVSVKEKRKQSFERSSSTDSRQSSRERSVTAGDEQEMDTGSGLYSARGIVPVFENQIIDEILEYYRVNESIKYDDISRISQNIYKETRPTFKASHNWIKDFMSRHSEKLGHIVIQNAREFLTNKEKREVLAEVDKHGLQYVSKVTNISQAQLLAWKDQLSNTPPPQPSPSSALSTPSTPVSVTIPEPPSTRTPPVQGAPGVRARKYSMEEKKMYAAECEKHGITFVSSHYNVPKTNLGRWMAQFKTRNKELEPSEPQETPETEQEEHEEIETKEEAIVDTSDISDTDKVVIDWVLQRHEDIGIVVVTSLLDFAQETICKGDASFQATEEWLSGFLAKHSNRVKGIKFRYPEEVAKNYLQNFTQKEKEKLSEAPEKLNRPVVEIAALAGILPHSLYDWRKNNKKKKLRESYETPSPAPPKRTPSLSRGTPSPSMPKSLPAPSQLKSTPGPSQSSSPTLLVPKTEPVDPDEADGKSKMQEKLARIENKYSAVEKQAIADEARKDGTSAVARTRGIPLPLVLKWMKMFPNTVPATLESTPKSGNLSTPSVPKSVSERRSESAERGLKVKVPYSTKEYIYKSKQVTNEEKHKFALEVRTEGVTAVANRTGIPKSTLYHWQRQLEEEEADEENKKKKFGNEENRLTEMGANKKKNARTSKSATPEVKKEAVDLDSFSEEQKKKIALETKSLGFEETAKKRGIPTAVVIEWMGLYLDQSPTSEKGMSSEKTATSKRVYTEEEKCKVAEQALDIGPKETAQLTGIHLSNVTRWMNTFKKRLKGRQYALDRKEHGQNTQSRNEKKHKMIQGIMRENSQTDSHTSEQNLSRSSSVNSELDLSTEPKTVADYTYEDKLRLLQAADEMGVRNASIKFKVDPSLIFQWRRLYDYNNPLDPRTVTSSPSATSSVSSTPNKSKSTSSIITSTPKTPPILNIPKPNTSSVASTPLTGGNEFDSIVISDDDGSCSPCSNHSWQSDDMNDILTHKRKADSSGTDLSQSAKKSRLNLSQSFGIEDDVTSDVIDFAYTPEQKQSIVKDSNIHGLEKVSKMTNIPVSLIIAWKAQFPNVSPVKTEKH